MKYCITTRIFNNYEPVREPLEIDPNADYILFTDDKTLTSKTWNVIYLEELDTDNLIGIQKNFLLKYQFHKYVPNIEQYDYFIVIDQSIVIYKSLKPIIDYINDNNYDLSVAPHYWRDNFLNEYYTWVKCRSLNKEYVRNFFEQIKDYNYNSINGMVETSMIICKNNLDVFNMLDNIYQMMKSKSDVKDGNDQCYFTYCLYKTLDKLNVNYHSASLYRYSDYMKMFVHGTDKTTQTHELIYKSYNIKFLNQDITINQLNEYDK